MKKIVVFLIVFCAYFGSFSVSLSQFIPPFGGGLETSVTASVGDIYLNISGVSSPFSSVILTSDAVKLRSTVANEKGSFSLSQVLVKRGLTNLCLTTIDFRNLGQSITCINFQPLNSSLTLNDLFLPPTLVLTKSKIANNESSLAYGYTAQYASVTIHINDKQTITTKADANGYYKFILKLPVGKYNLFTTARVDSFDARGPSKTVSLQVLSEAELIVKRTGDFLSDLIGFLLSIPLGILWFVIPLIILIIILLFKLWGRGIVTSIASFLNIILVILPLGNKKLHHWWFMGY